MYDVDSLLAVAARNADRPPHPLGLQQSCPNCPRPGVEKTCYSTADLADELHVPQHVVKRWRRDGLDELEADQAAVHLGLVMCLIWDLEPVG